VGVEKRMGHKEQQKRTVHDPCTIAAAVGEKACLQTKRHRAVKKSILPNELKVNIWLAFI